MGCWQGIGNAVNGGVGDRAVNGWQGEGIGKRQPWCLWGANRPTGISSITPLARYIGSSPPHL